MEDRILSQSAMAADVTAANSRPAKGARKPGSGKALLEHILSSLDQDKAEGVVTIALKGKSEMADHMVIASGRSSRQVMALAEKLADRLKHDMGLICRIEGKDQGDWVLIDAGDVIVHIFRPEVRDFYQLEKLWAEPGTPDPAR
ncbi:MAG TPA: ribosome silencing factor [Aliiroseovarius sp.]|nr:ribosome silencing factor [Aliiroseovarius sp.]